MESNGYYYNKKDLNSINKIEPIKNNLSENEKIIKSEPLIKQETKNIRRKIKKGRELTEMEKFLLNKKRKMLNPITPIIKKKERKLSLFKDCISKEYYMDKVEKIYNMVNIERGKCKSDDEIMPFENAKNIIIGLMKLINQKSDIYKRKTLNEERVSLLNTMRKSLTIEQIYDIGTNVLHLEIEKDNLSIFPEDIKSSNIRKVKKKVREYMKINKNNKDFKNYEEMINLKVEKELTNSTVPTTYDEIMNDSIISQSIDNSSESS